MPDWITQFVEATSTIRSPEPFRLWAGIGTVAAALERRVWTMTDVDKLYPNLYTVLVGLPASGKTNVVKESRKMLAPMRGMHIGPDNPTEASFKDALAASQKVALNGGGGTIYSALTLLCREFKVLIPKYNDAFLADLSDLYDNPAMYTAPRRTSVSVAIEAPTVNIIAAATPDALGMLPESAWGEGFTSRIIFIYGISPTNHRDIFNKRIDTDMKSLQDRIQTIFSEIHGEFDWDSDARKALNSWYNDDNMAPVPTYGRLINYNGRRIVHVMKLSMVSAVSAGHWPNVTLDDFIRGRQWLLDAEKTMPDVFRAIMQKSDGQLLQDLHYSVYAEWSKVARDKRVPVSEKFIWSFLENRATSDKIPRLIEAAEKSGRIKRTGFAGQWIPNSLDFIAPEMGG